MGRRTAPVTKKLTRLVKYAIFEAYFLFITKFISKKEGALNASIYNQGAYKYRKYRTIE